MEKSRKNVLALIAKKLKTPEDFDQFFEEALTPQEYYDLIERVLICEELMKGSTVQDVCKKIGVASATVVRGNRVLKYGNGKMRSFFESPRKK